MENEHEGATENEAPNSSAPQGDGDARPTDDDGANKPAGEDAGTSAE